MNLRIILGDQLSHSITALKDIDAQNDVIMMCEVMEEATYVKHHKKKIAFIFSAMRHFAEELREKGYNVRYTKLDDAENKGSFADEVAHAAQSIKPDKIIITEAAEYRVHEMIKSWESELNIPVEIREDDRFLCTHEEFKDWAENRKELRMEYFYREMRKKYNILMKDGKPEGGEWNYDSMNRKTPKDGIKIPTQYTAQTDEITKSVIKLVSDKFNHHFGDIEPFFFAVTRDQALYALNKFIEERLSNFGDYQDAMIQGEPWLFHSHLSFYINCGLLLPLECIKAAEDAYNDKRAPLNAVEGFIRQILGWREYVRGIYWLKMPEYENLNHLNAEAPLPPLFWDAKTHMNCMRQCIKETKENAYAHHIQRLMIIGNFSLIAGLSPDEVNNWYMLVYADAYQWVELPNVTGMILYADGGLLASKPYAASGAYINKMSDYCKKCKYSVTKKNGPQACPFNYLYWDFLIRNEEKLSKNPRLRLSYKTISNMSEEKISAIKEDRSRFLNKLKNHDCI